GGIHALADEVEVFLHLVDEDQLAQPGGGGGGVESADVVVHLAERDGLHGPAGEGVAALGEDPRVADGVAADHDAGRAGLAQHAHGGGGGGDVAVGEHGA